MTVLPHGAVGEITSGRNYDVTVMKPGQPAEVIGENVPAWVAQVIVGTSGPDERAFVFPHGGSPPAPLEQGGGRSTQAAASRRVRRERAT